MQTSILVVSFIKDKPWLEYCLKSITKFCSGFKSTVIVVPDVEINAFKSMPLPDCMMLTTYRRASDQRKWHLHHQAVKCRADELCRDSDFILHTDSDCIFTEPVTPEDYFVNGKPVMLVESFKHVGPSNWKKTTDDALGIDSKWETMRRHPAVHYRGMYPEFRNEVSKQHKLPFDTYVLSCKPDFPWGFSEFNALGNFIMESPTWRPKYEVVDLEHSPRPKDKLLQFWSHWGLDGTISDRGPHFGMKPRDIIDSILK